MPLRPSDRSSGPVRHAFTGTVLGPAGDTAVDLELRYDPACPYAVEARFSVGERPVSWVFARELLAAGQFEPVGRGDVHVRPHLDDDGHAAVLLELQSPDGVALIELPAREVRPFVTTTADVVAPGTESHHIDVDAALRAVLAAD